MSELNRDILYLIFKELQYDRKSFHSCLLVNKLWCKIIVPILWINPWKKLNRRNTKERKLLLNVILSCLSDDLKSTLKNQGVRILYQRPLFDYISFCRHLNLNKINSILSISMYKQTKTPTIKNEIFKLFINENTNCTHLYITHPFRLQIHLFPGAKHCFSNLKFFHCDANVDDDVLVGLSKICNSIKELKISIGPIENKRDEYGIIKLVESLQKLYSVNLSIGYHADKPFGKTLENSLIKHANTIQYFKTTHNSIIKYLSSFVNLRILEFGGNNYYGNLAWESLENVPLPSLQILNTRNVPAKSLTSLIENTSGNLIEINAGCIYHEEIDNKKIIQAIYQNCPNLKYLKLLFSNGNLSELENLLIHCQYLNGLFIVKGSSDRSYDWNSFFKMLARSSPTSLFRFKFLLMNHAFRLPSLKSFLDNWKSRRPMLLQIASISTNRYFDLVNGYIRKGIVKKYDNNVIDFEDFEWIQKKVN